LILFIYFSLALIVPWVIFFIWFNSQVLYKYLCDNVVLVSEFNYPRIHHLAAEVKEALSVEKEVDIFVYEAKSFNSIMVRIFTRRAIYINSEILESGVEDDEVRWLVGRFIGYLRVRQDAGFVGHLVRMTELSGIFTLLVFPYTRAMVYTGDRLGLATINGNIEATTSAIQKLLVGRSLGYSVNPLGLIEQRRATKGSLFALLARAGSPFPSTISRYVDLLAFAKSAFPQDFANFEAGCPGLPEDLDGLSAETATPGVFGKLFGLMLAIFAGLCVTFLVWAYWISLIQQSAMQAVVDDSSSPYVIEEPAAIEPDSAAAAAAEAEAEAEAPRIIANPVFVAGPTPEQIQANYPVQSLFERGVGSIECGVNADGTVHSCTPIGEEPSNSGFGAAAASLAYTIRLAQTDGDGLPVGGAIAQIAITFEPAPE